MFLGNSVSWGKLLVFMMECTKHRNMWIRELCFFQ